MQHDCVLVPVGCREFRSDLSASAVVFPCPTEDGQPEFGGETEREQASGGDLTARQTESADETVGLLGGLPGTTRTSVPAPECCAGWLFSRKT